MNNIIPTADSPQAGYDPLALDNEEETLVIDTRATFSPSQLVEQKLIGRLKESPLLVSQIQRRLKPGPR